MSPSEPILHQPTLHTQRLVLRKLRIEDASDYFAFAGDPQVVRYLRWGPHASLQETETYLAGVLDNHREISNDLLWGIELEQQRRLVGTIHLMEIDGYHLRADVGVVVNSQCWSQGIASEALGCVLAFCFQELRLHRVQGLAVTGNAAACRVMEKCGMVREGTLRRCALQKGQWRDFDLYAILADEFC